MMIANGPGHRVLAIGKETGTVGRDAPRTVRGGLVGHTDDRGSAVREEGGGNHLLRVPIVVMVQYAQLNGTQKDSCGRVGFDEGASHAQAVEGPVTSHEADMSALHRRGQAELLDDLD